MGQLLTTLNSILHRIPSPCAPRRVSAEGDSTAHGRDRHGEDRYQAEDSTGVGPLLGIDEIRYFPEEDAPWASAASSCEIGKLRVRYLAMKEIVGPATTENIQNMVAAGLADFGLRE